ncbi:MAG: helix-turn-helix transcriptional regulator [Bacteroidales bacterium]|nr:helix-turn-helix transcriptional regulator [Bacteroidales bacterium]
MRIKELLKQKGITAKELAAKLNLSEGALSQSMNGNPTLERLTQIATALGVSVSELFEEPRKDSTVITCPHCGKPITINAEK